MPQKRIATSVLKHVQVSISLMLHVTTPSNAHMYDVERQNTIVVLIHQHLSHTKQTPDIKSKLRMGS